MAAVAPRSGLPERGLAYVGTAARRVNRAVQRGVSLRLVAADLSPLKSVASREKPSGVARAAAAPLKRRVLPRFAGRRPRRDGRAASGEDVPRSGYWPGRALVAVIDHIGVSSPPRSAAA